MYNNDETWINNMLKCSFGGTYRHSVKFETLQLRPVGNRRAVVSWEEELRDKRTTTNVSMNDRRK